MVGGVGRAGRDKQRIGAPFAQLRCHRPEILAPPDVGGEHFDAENFRACNHRVGRKDDVRFFAHDFGFQRINVAAAFHPAHNHQIAAFDVTQFMQALREGSEQRVSGVEIDEDADAPDFFCWLGGLRERAERRCQRTRAQCSE